jgi:4-phosphopantoate---beta-alanine ligase
MTFEVTSKHPRYESLRIRERLVSGYLSGIVAASGLIAHGRGEAFDYLLGEETIEPAARATRAAAAALILAKKPVISVNGNSAILAAKEFVKLSESSYAPIEVNLYHPSVKRKLAIKRLLEKAGANMVLGVAAKEYVSIEDIASPRRYVDRRGIFQSDVVLIPLEDGDRTEALRRLAKKIIAVDLNPLSRTSRYASITIVDNVVRAIPNLTKSVNEMKKIRLNDLEKTLAEFDNQKNLRDSIKIILERLFEISASNSPFLDLDESQIGLKE